ncbi:MAG: amidohydrolase family protein [Sulfurimonadaceae bacterium]|jgi:dihydroorotase|nr:amidohydrolase family protein [Sulfurimonadaceae bacterium]
MVIKNVTICDANKEILSDIEIVDGVIKQIEKDIKTDEFIDGSGKFLLPMLVDLNVNVLDGSLSAKNIKELSLVAKAGGVGRVVLNPTTTPPLDNEIALEFAQNALHDLSGAKVDLAINTLKEDASLSNIAILLKKGAKAVYMSTIAKNDLAIRIAQYSQMYGVTLFVKAEDNSLISSGVMLEGDVSSKLGLAGIPDLSEVLHVSRMIEIAREFKISIVFKSLASPRSIYLIKQAKKDGVDVKCEVSIHHLLHTDESCKGFNTYAKLNPPLASQSDRFELLEYLANGDIDMLSTLHQPSSPLYKEIAFYDAAYGCDGLSDALSAYYSKFVKTKTISMLRLVELCVKNPLKTLGEDGGVIEVGKKIDTLLFEPNHSFVVDDKTSLNYGCELNGKIEAWF